MADLYQTVTNTIINLIEQKKLNSDSRWFKNAGFKMPVNLKTGNQYSGVNILLLWAACHEKNYSKNEWLTFKQAEEMGYRVLKGEKSTHGVYFNTFKKEVENIKTGDVDELNIPFLKTLFFFNVEQLEGYTINDNDISENKRDFFDNIKADSIICNSHANINHGSNSAYYSRMNDSIQMPNRADFKNDNYYYATLLHELTHWTGSEKRLDRQFGKKFGDNAYAFEELVAELGASFLGSECGIFESTQENHAHYLESWLNVLKNDKKAIFTACNQASKAHQFLMNNIKD